MAADSAQLFRGVIEEWNREDNGFTFLPISVFHTFDRSCFVNVKHLENIELFLRTHNSSAASVSKRTMSELVLLGNR